MTRVLPEPAPASTRAGPSRYSTASLCGPFRPNRGALDMWRTGKKRGSGQAQPAIVPSRPLIFPWLEEYSGIRLTTFLSTMKFEHLIEINDPLNPLIDTLTHEQVWRGLVLRAESPKLFVPHLDEVRIGERTDTGFRRTQRYGDLVI